MAESTAPLLARDTSTEPETVTKKELIGWLSFSWAAEPFAIAGMGTYVPVLLDEFARINGVLKSDRLVSCLQPVIPTPPGDISDPSSPNSCVIKLFGHYVSTESYVLYTISISVLMQAILVISISGPADLGNLKRLFLLSFAFAGSIATMMFGSLYETQYYAVSLLTILSNVCFGCVTVCGNSFLPSLARYYPSTLNNQENSLEAHQIKDNEESRISNRLSGLGVAIGYSSAFLIQFLTIALIVMFGSTTYSVQLALTLVGLWWFLFSFVTLKYSVSRSSITEEEIRNKPKSYFGSITYGWVNIGATLAEAKELRDILLFLAGWFLVSDGATTINSAAILFAKSELYMQSFQLAFIGVLVVIFGVIGAFTVPKLIAQSHLSTSTAGIIGSICLTCLIPIYGIIGIWSPKIGLNNQLEMYFLAMIYGLALGGLNSTCRSTYALLIPPGKESMYFALYSITDKGSSVIGPLVTGYIIDKYDNIRYAFYFLLFMLAAPLPIFYLVNVPRGRKMAANLANSRSLES